MGKKDTSEKYLEDFPDVFADILNVTHFGEKVIDEDYLFPGPTESIYKAENGIDVDEQRRDVAKYYFKDWSALMLLGVENQGKIDKDMPFRIMGYDYASYRAQIRNGDMRYPVISTILHFGNEEWKKPLSLIDCLEVPEEMRRYVQDYKIHVVNVAFLPKEIRKKFKSDFRFVADYFYEMRVNNDYVPSTEEIKHVEAVLNMLYVFTRDERYKEITPEMVDRQRKGEAISMCAFLDKAENRGMQKGIQQGIQLSILNIYHNMINRGYSEDEARLMSGVTDEMLENEKN